ncbi:MAG: hypothetical protein DDT26_01602 [Dehalococcoidia bacterium]|nr:hypothetical protein [Chloroflexota bacterium]
MLAFIIVLVAAIVRVAPLGAPTVYSDEYSYSAVTAAFLKGMAAPSLAPALDNWLFIALFSVSHVGHVEPVHLARLINAAVVALGVLPLLWVASTQCRDWRSVLLSVAYSTLFVGGMAAYFMPEAFYFSIVSAAFCVLVAYAAHRTARFAILMAIVVACAALTKVHALLLVPGFVIAMALIHWPSGMTDARRMFVHIAVFVGVTWFIVSGTKSIVAGQLHLNPLGPFYSGMAGSVDVVALPTEPLSFVLLQHLAILAIVIGPYLVLAGIAAVRFVARARGSRPSLVDVGCFAALGSLVGMLLVTVLFSVSVASHGGYESLTRMHGRYYEHLAWLAAYFGLLALPSLCDDARACVRWLIAVSAMAAVWLGYLTLSPLGWQNPVDFSSIFALSRLPNGPLIAAILSSIVCLGLLLPWPVVRTTLATSAFVAWLGLNTWTLESFRWSTPPSAVDSIGMMLSSSERADSSLSRVEVFAVRRAADVFRLAYWLEEEEVELRITDPRDGTCLRPSEGAEWIVVLEGAATPCSYVMQLEKEGVSLWRSQ